MKLIKKYQYGGIAYTPISRDILEWPPKGAAQESSESKKSNDGIDSAIMKALEENGIPVDVDYFWNAASSFLNKSKNLYSSGNSSATISQLAQIRSLANRVRFNNNLFEKAEARVRSNNTGSDVALDNRGRIYTITNSGEIKKIDVETYYSNPEDYNALSYDDLLNMRATNPNLIFNDNVLNDISNSIGMNSVMNRVIEIIQKFGSDEKAFYVGSNQEISDGIKALIEGGPDGYYRIDIKDPKIEKALGHIYRSLNNNAVNVLKATAAAEGKNPNTREGIYELLLEAIYQHTSPRMTPSYSRQFDDVKGRKSGSGSDSDGNLGDKEGYGQSIISHFGASRTRTIRNRGSNVEYTIDVKHNQIRDKDGEIMSGLDTLDEVYDAMAKNGLVVDRDNMYFGGMYNENDKKSVVGDIVDVARIDPNKSREVIVDSSKGMELISVPITIDGRPDFGAIERYQAAKEEIEENGYTDMQDIFAVYQKYYLDNNLDSNGNLLTGDFIAVRARTPEHGNTVIGYDRSNPTIERLGQSERADFKHRVDYMNQTREKNNKVKIKLGWIHDRGVLSGTIFLPLYVNQVQQAISDDRARTDKRSGSEYQQMQEIYADPRTMNGVYTGDQQLRTSFNDL